MRHKPKDQEGGSRTIVARTTGFRCHEEERKSNGFGGGKEVKTPEKRVVREKKVYSLNTEGNADRTGRRNHSEEERGQSVKRREVLRGLERGPALSVSEEGGFNWLRGRREKKKFGGGWHGEAGNSTCRGFSGPLIVRRVSTGLKKYVSGN